MIDVDRRENVTRVPVEAIRWVAGRAYVALHDKDREAAGQPPWRWQEIEIGLSDPTYAEVIKGLSPGDRVVYRPATLPPPKSDVVAKPLSGLAAR